MRIPSHLRIASVVTGVVLASGIACKYPFAPDEGDVRPELELLVFSNLGTNLNDGGVLFINGLVADTSFRLQRGQRVPIEVHSTSGDVENLGLYRRVCPARDRAQGYTCFSFIVSFAGPYDLDDIRARAAAMGGRLSVMSTSLVSVTLFDPEKVMSGAREAESWPGVAYTWTSVPGCIGIGQCVSRSTLYLPVPVDHAPPIQGDGILQVQPKDTVFFRYTQPDGSQLEGMVGVP